MKYEPRPEVKDDGLDESIKKLTPEKIKETIRFALDKECGARLKVYMDTCVHCGLCATACHQCISHDMDPKYAPVAKVKDTLVEIFKKDCKVSPEFMKLAARIAYIECGGCRRCSMYCPFGIDIAYLLMVVRRICSMLGVVPMYLQDTTNSHSVTYNQMWVQQDEWIDTLQWQEEDAQKVVKTARIPLEKEGADIMYSVIAPEPKILAQLLANAAVIFAVAGLDWTMPATDGWDNSNMAMYSGDFESSGRLERLHHETAMRLKVKKIVMGECGHAFRGAVYDGPRHIGQAYPAVPVIHAIEFYHDLITSGKIKIVKKFKKPVTVQDPCNTVRGRGLGGKLRDLMNWLCEDFRDMNPRFEHNYCCGAGGGVINCGPPWTRNRVVANRTKGDQINATGAEVVVTPCHNCHSGIEDIIKEYAPGTHVKFISELLVDEGCMEIPEHLRPGGD